MSPSLSRMTGSIHTKSLSGSAHIQSRSYSGDGSMDILPTHGRRHRMDVSVGRATDIKELLIHSSARLVISSPPTKSHTISRRRSCATAKYGWRPYETGSGVSPILWVDWERMMERSSYILAERLCTNLYGNLRYVESSDTHRCEIVSSLIVSSSQVMWRAHPCARRSYPYCVCTLGSSGPAWGKSIGTPPRTFLVVS